MEESEKNYFGDLLGRFFRRSRRAFRHRGRQMIRYSAHRIALLAKKAFPCNATNQQRVLDVMQAFPRL